MSKMNFIDACLNGDALLEDIDDYIDEWHEGEYREEIYEFLGMTQREYRLWVEDDSCLRDIIKCHMNGIDIDELLKSTEQVELKMVARAKNKEEAKALYELAKKHGKI